MKSKNQCNGTERTIAMRSDFQLYFEGVKDFSELSSFICDGISLLTVYLSLSHPLAAPMWKCFGFRQQTLWITMITDSFFVTPNSFIFVDCHVAGTQFTLLHQWQSPTFLRHPQHPVIVLQTSTTKNWNAGGFICSAHTAWMLVTVKVNDVSLKKNNL